MLRIERGTKNGIKTDLFFNIFSHGSYRYIHFDKDCNSGYGELYLDPDIQDGTEDGCFLVIFVWNKSFQSIWKRRKWLLNWWRNLSVSRNLNTMPSGAPFLGRAPHDRED